MATDAASLMSQGKCYACFSANTFQIMKLALLAQLSTNMATDPQSLLSQAQCYVCMGVSIAEAMELALLADIVNNGGGGGGGGSNWFQGNYGGGTPTPTPTGAAGAIDTSTGQFWIFTSGAWQATGIFT